jgi:hypothetical protein
MIASVAVVDTVSRVAPFGVRFWDRVTGTVVRDGLRVTMHPSADARWVTSAIANRSGVHVLHSGPGLAAATWGEGDDRYWTALTARVPYRFEVTDEQLRFHPMSFDVQLPHRGLFQPECEPSPPGAADTRLRALHDTVELFSTPTRAMPGALGVIRAELADAADGKPASWARICVEAQGELLGHGVADSAGRALVLFALPEPGRSALGSPPTSPPFAAGGALFTWDVRLRAYHSRALESVRIPDYCAVVRQPEVTLLAQQSPPAELAVVTVALGRDAVLSSYGDSKMLVDHG